MKKICIYGKGGIGKSTIVSNIAATLANEGMNIVVVGCDPKADSTRNIMGSRIPTVLNIYKEKGESNIQLEDIVFSGYKGISCIEAGGPEPGTGCAGRGIITVMELIDSLNVFNILKPDVVIYDVLGDVVCGGFSMPLREGIADEVYIVTTSDFMSLYAANNICKGIKKYASRGTVRLSGIIYNERGVVNNNEIIEEFASVIGTKIIGRLPKDEVISKAELNRKTVIEYSPENKINKNIKEIAINITNNSGGIIPSPIEEEELETLCQRIAIK